MQCMGAYLGASRHLPGTIQYTGIFIKKLQIFLALSSGACLLIVPTKVKQSPRSLSRVLFLRQFVTVLQVTPALIRQLPESVISSRLLGPESCVRVLALGGEACPSLNTLAQWKSPKVHGHNIIMHIG